MFVAFDSTVQNLSVGGGGIGLINKKYQYRAKTSKNYVCYKGVCLNIILFCYLVF